MLDWQSIVALMIVAAAGGILIRRTILKWSTGQISGCHGCSKKCHDGSQLIQLESKTRA